MSDYADEFIRRSLRINRVAAGEAIKAAGKAATIESRIEAAMMRLADGDFNFAARQRAISSISNIIKEQFEQAGAAAEDLAEKLVQSEAEWQVKILESYSTSSVSSVVIEDIAKIARATPYQGKTFQSWFKEAGVKSPRKAAGIIEAGFVEGKSVSQVTSEIKLLTKKSIPQIRTLVRSNLLHASAIGREQAVQANRDILEGKIWNSTLDVRTTVDICGIRDGLEYDMNNSPIGHSVPWGAGPSQIHFNCRSISIPKISGVDSRTKRPSVGAGKEYERGDNKTRTGKVRKPTKANRDNDIFKVQQKAAGTNYESWLRSQKTDFVADAMGSKAKAVAFKNGESLSSLTNTPLGTNLTINQL